ncbi:MAG: FtsQ-type POTRA domain-containing protein [Lachnospiraceae bacterium]|nr:FtsQ-type POTRA domain-containing protein [Lachnospiraceae bacterium]
MSNHTEEQRGGIRGLIRFIAVAVILGALVLLFYGVFRTEEITVEGLTYYTKEEFLTKISDETARKNTLLFRLEQFRNGEQRVPYIERYDITVEGKNVIHIRVYEKILVGSVKVMGQYLYFDKDGYVTETSVEQLPGVPLVKGLEFDRIVLYEKLKIQKDELYDIILNITKLVREYEIPAESITFNGKGEVELEVGTCSVAMGRRTAYDLPIQKLADLLPSVTDRNLYIDLSGYSGGTEDIIAKPKEE